MGKKLIPILLLLLTVFVLAGKAGTKVVPLPELMKPHNLALGENQIYIAEKAAVYIFSLKDFKFIKKFGKKGEGPGEFKRTASNVIVQPNHLLINSQGKILYFTKDGKYIKEFRTPAQDKGFKPFTHQFVAARTWIENGIIYAQVNIFDSNLERLKEIYRVPLIRMGGKGTNMFAPIFPYYPIGDKLFIAKENDLVIAALDKNCDKLYSITRDYEKIKVTEEDKEQALHHLKTKSPMKSVLEMMKPIIFPDYFPAIRRYYIADKSIYVFTYKKKEAKRECLIFDIKGKFLKQVFLPYIVENFNSDYPAAIKNGKLYQLIDNEETEEWELHVTDIM